MERSTREFLSSSTFLKENIRVGVERETLRVDLNAKTSLNPHPESLGQKLTHPSITTDYSENLMEFITGVHKSFGPLSDELKNIHGFVHQNIDDELLWPSSMPAVLPVDSSDIPIANFGNSHIGKLKSLYRVGLGVRYGRSMQSIAGVHYNFSLSDDFWSAFKDFKKCSLSLKEFKNENYFNLIRNFMRYRWLLIYLFSASNIVDKSFLVGKEHNLKKLTDDTFYDPDAVSLRMGRFGYTSKAQEDIHICFNKVETYVKTLENARLSSYVPYEKIGEFKDSERIQLNTNILQIDNEFYSTIRPKNIAKSKESALMALHKRGIEYIEVRLCDVNPFSSIGFEDTQSEFLNVFLLWCLFSDSPNISSKECHETEENFNEIVTSGNKKDLKLLKNSKEVYFKDWACELFTKMRGFSELLGCEESFEYFYSIIRGERENLSTKQLSLIGTDSFKSFNLKLAKKYKSEFLEKKINQFKFNQLVSESRLSEQKLVSESQGDFEGFLKMYFQEIKINF